MAKVELTEMDTESSSAGVQSHFPTLEPMIWSESRRSSATMMTVIPSLRTKVILPRPGTLWTIIDPIWFLIYDASKVLSRPLQTCRDDEKLSWR